MNTPVTLGLVGCGRWGKLILRDLLSLGCRVHVVARSETSRNHAIQGGCTSIVSSIAELPAIDGAVIATSTSTHYDCIQQLLPRNIPLYIEKPLTAALAEAHSLQPYADRLFVMDKWRYHSGVQTLAQLAQSGTLGTVQSLYCTRWGWRSHERDVDALWYLAPHDLAIILEILGFVPQVHLVRAEYHRGTLSGAVVILGDQPWAELRISETRERHQREIRVHGSAGFAILPDSYSTAIALYRTQDVPDGKAPEPEWLPVADDMPLLAELRAFVEYVQGGPAPKSSFADTLAMMTALERMHELV